MGVLGKDRRNTETARRRRSDMQGKQKTLESFDAESRAVPEGTHPEALSMSDAQSEEAVAYGDLIEKVLDDENIVRALRRVVANNGAPGVDGKSVDDLALWLQDHTEDLKEEIRSGNYIPVPVRRKEIPKPNGGVRNLGIPTAKDRLVQQMIAQVLTPMYDPTFSESSFGFRPGRSAQDAVRQCKAFYDEGYHIVVDLDLEKFFDNLNQRFLMNILRERIKDQVLIRLIKRFLRAGVAMPDGIVEATPRGSPQGGPLSPLLSNIYLDRFDKELERRGLRFCRYADDCVIFVKSSRAGSRVCDSVTRYLEEEMLLKVNREKTHVGSPRELPFLGFVLTRKGKDGAGITVHSDKVKRFKRNVRRITKRHRGISVGKMISELTAYVRGWFGYFRLSTNWILFQKMDKWIRRRVRQFMVKQWKRKWTIANNLRALCPRSLQANVEFQGVPKEWTHLCWAAATTEGWWQMSISPAVQQGISNQMLESMGLFSMFEHWRLG